MQVIESPAPLFLGLDGAPLDSGSVYIGTVGQNPETSAISVYWDYALTQPAAQPLKTVSGYISRNGTVANVYTASDYSISIRDKRGQLVCAFPDSSQINNGSIIATASAKPAATIAVLRAFLKTGAPYAQVAGYYAKGDGGGGAYYYDASDISSPDNGGSTIVAADGGRWKLQVTDSMTPRQFGAKGDGVTDDTLAFFNCATACVTLGVKMIVPSGTYICDALDLPATLHLEGIGKNKAIIKRKANSTATYLARFNNAYDFTVTGLQFDGNKANQTLPANNLLLLGCWSYRVFRNTFKNAKDNALSYGSGLQITSGANSANNADSIVSENEFLSNGSEGFQISNEFRLTVDNNIAAYNGNSGIDLYVGTLGTSDAQDYITLSGNQCHDNVKNGIGVFSDLYTPAFGSANIVVDGNICYNNAQVGISAQGNKVAVTSNACMNNGAANPVGMGILFNCQKSTCVGNTLINNGHYGIDAGWAVDSVISGNAVTCNGIAGSGAVGINIGSSNKLLVEGNEITLDASYSVGAGIYSQGTEQDGGGFGMSNSIFTANSRICDNLITLSANGQKGIVVKDGLNSVHVGDNIVAGTFVNTDIAEIVVNTTNFREERNRDLAHGMSGVSLASAATLILPDIGEDFTITGTTNITSILTNSQNNYNQKVTAVNMSAGGSGYTSSFSVSFTGGGGAGATGLAIVDRAGKVVGVVMTNNGSGYTSAPTPNFSAGAGTGAAATATLGVLNYEGRRIRLKFASGLTVTRGAGLVVTNPTVTPGANGELILIGSAAAGGFVQQSFFAG